MIVHLPFRLGFSFSCWPLIVVSAGSHDGEATLVHEQVHYSRQRWITPCWVLRYFVSRKFRLREELIAYKAEIAFLEARDGSVDYGFFARMLSDNLYQDMCDYDEALKMLKGEA